MSFWCWYSVVWTSTALYGRQGSLSCDALLEVHDRKRSNFYESKAVERLSAGNDTVSWIIIQKQVHQDNFRQYLFFSSRSAFFWIFPGGFIFLPNRYHFSTERLFCSSNSSIFPERFFFFAEQIPFFRKVCVLIYQTYTNFPGALIFGTQTEPPYRYFRQVAAFVLWVLIIHYWLIKPEKPRLAR